MTEIVRVEPAIVDRLDPIADIVLNTVNGGTQRAYARALLGHYGPRSTEDDPLGFLPWLSEQRSGFNRASVNAYVAYLQDSGITRSSINQRLAAIRKLADESAQNGLLDHPTATAIASVRNLRIEGKKTGNWLTAEQARAMIDRPDLTTRKGVRDRAMLSLLLGSGLRREEIVSLTLGHFQRREGRWVILNIVGKRNKVRTVPIADWVKEDVDRWVEKANIVDPPTPLFLRFRKGDQLVRTGVTSQTVWLVVQEYAPVTGLAPHDLRRTFAKLARKGGAPLEQIQHSLGHDSIQTTENYVGAEQDFEQAPSDFIRI